MSRAGHEVAVFYQGARFGAISRATRVRLELSGDSLLAVYEGARDSVFHVWPGPAPDGVTLVATRPILRIGPTGLGFGAANTKILLSRGEASESLTTSRLGRLKRWR